MRFDVLPRHVRARPGLWSSIAIALLTTGLCTQLMRFSQAVLVGWCCGAVVYLAVLWHTVRKGLLTDMKERAALLDEGSGFIFCVTVIAAIASVSAIVLDLGHAKQEGGIVLPLSGATLILSWFFVQTVFASHYAHLWFVDSKSLTFPGEGDPEYGDFVYFALVIGMTAQVSDVTTGNSRIRRLVLVHSVISFFFNTAILALGVNIAAGLVGGGA